MVNFSVLPPEINSGRMFFGAGSGPMLAAAAAWDGMAMRYMSAAGMHMGRHLVYQMEAGEGLSGIGERKFGAGRNG